MYRRYRKRTTCCGVWGVGTGRELLSGVCVCVCEVRCSMWGRVGLCGIVRGWVGMWCGREDRARACEACGWAREARCGREDLGRQCVVCSEGGGWARAGVRVCVGVCVCGCVCGCVGVWRRTGGGRGGGGQLPFSPSNPLPPSLLSSRYYAPLEAPPPHPLCVSYAPLPLRVGPHTTAPLHHSVGRVGSCGTYGVGSERIVRGWVGMRAWGKARDKNAVWVVWDRVGSYGRE